MFSSKRLLRKNRKRSHFKNEVVSWGKYKLRKYVESDKAHLHGISRYIKRKYFSKNEEALYAHALVLASLTVTKGMLQQWLRCLTVNEEPIS